MGVSYSVACKTCKVTRDLDKFYNHGSGVETRKDALAHSEQISSDSFRASLLVSFMSKHTGHECVFFSENSEVCSEKYDPFYNEQNNFKEDTDFWND